MKVAVVILNWNGVGLLEKFLPSVIQHTNNSIADIYVADNHSNDTSIEFLTKYYPTIKIISLEKNYGFAEGYNQALKNIIADYFVLLNTDVEVTPNWLEPMLDLISQHPDAAVVMPKIKDYNNKEKFEYAGAAGGFIDKYGYAFCRGRIFNDIEKDNGQYDNETDVFWAAGACFMINSMLYLKSGGLDKDFFAHMEEIDLCWRLKNMGYRILFTPHSTIYHVGGGTLSHANPFKTYLNFRNNLFLLYKNLPQNKLFKTLFIRFILDGVAAIRFLAKLELGNFIAVAKAHLHFYYYFRKFNQKRKFYIKTLFTAFNHNEILNKSIIYRAFIKKEKTFREIWS
jgi:GT2 family glycosyltransferase